MSSQELISSTRQFSAVFILFLLFILTKLEVRLHSVEMYLEEEKVYRESINTFKKFGYKGKIEISWPMEGDQRSREHPL